MLEQIYGSDKKWVELARETKQMIDENRDKRDAFPRPIYKREEEYLQELRDKINKWIIASLTWLLSIIKLEIELHLLS